MQFDPWVTNPEHPFLSSPTKDAHLVFNGDEICMGGPLGGFAFIQETEYFIFISDSCGLPGLWSTNGRYFALPFWVEHRMQRIGLADMERMELFLSLRLFQVLHVQSFVGTILTFYDSPLTYAAHSSIDVSLGPWKLYRPLRRTPGKAIHLDWDSLRGLENGAEQEFFPMQHDESLERQWQEESSRASIVWAAEQRAKYRKKLPDAAESRFDEQSLGARRGTTGYRHPVWQVLLFALPLLLYIACCFLAGRTARLYYRLTCKDTEFSADTAREYEVAASEKTRNILLWPLRVVSRFIAFIRKT